MGPYGELLMHQSKLCKDGQILLTFLKKEEDVGDIYHGDLTFKCSYNLRIFWVVGLSRNPSKKYLFCGKICHSPTEFFVCQKGFCNERNTENKQST